MYITANFNAQVFGDTVSTDYFIPNAVLKVPFSQNIEGANIKRISVKAYFRHTAWKLNTTQYPNFYTIGTNPNNQWGSYINLGFGGGYPTSYSNCSFYANNGTLSAWSGTMYKNGYALDKTVHEYDYTFERGILDGKVVHDFKSAGWTNPNPSLRESVISFGQNGGVEWYKFLMHYDGKLVLDLRPVKTGDSTGFMDQLTRNLFLLKS